MVIRTFGDIMGSRVLSIVLLVHPCTDVRLWRSSVLPRVSLSNLYLIFRLEP